MRAGESWRFACPECGSVTLSRRSETGDYRCGNCGHIMAADERVDRRLVTDGGTTTGLDVDLGALIEQMERVRWVDVPGVSATTAATFQRMLVDARAELESGLRLVTDGGRDVPDPETFDEESVLLNVGEGKPEDVRRTLDGRPHRRGTWVNVNVLLPTAEVQRILLDMEGTNDDTIADFLRGGLVLKTVEHDRKAEHKVQVDVPVPDEAWKRASLIAATRYQLGKSPESAFWDTMVEAVSADYNYVPAGTDPSVEPYNAEALPIDRGAEVGKDHRWIGTDDPDDHREEHVEE